jgi:hypothetical protein
VGAVDTEVRQAPSLAKPPSSSAPELAAAPGEDPVAVEMRRITEQLREQSRR